METKSFVKLTMIFLVSFFTLMLSNIALGIITINEPGYYVRVFAENIPINSCPNGLAFGNGLFGNDLYSGTVGAVLKIPRGSSRSVFKSGLGDSVGGLIFGEDTPRRLYLLSAVSGGGGDNILEISENGETTKQISTGDSLTLGGTLTRDNYGDFSLIGTFFVGSAGSENILKIDSSGTKSNLTLPDSLKGVSSMTLGYDNLGSVFGRDVLFVADLNDPDSADQRGTNTIVKVSPSGEVTTFNRSNVDRPYSLRFGVNNIFGKSLFVGSRGSQGLPGTGSIFKIDENGNVSTFATGFRMPLALAFSNDGKSLFVGDYNSLPGDNLRIYEIYKISEGPTVISLSSFTASSIKGRVVLNWSTGTEIDNIGFNILRSESENGDYVRINKKIIKAKGNATKGAEYKFNDGKVKAGKTYYYKLEDIDGTIGSTQHGPVKVEVLGNKKKKGK